MTNWFQIYIQESEKLFKDQYSFNNFSFKNKREKSYITCKDHGDFKDYRIYTKASTELFKIDVLKNLSLDSFSTQKKES